MRKKSTTKKKQHNIHPPPSAKLASEHDLTPHDGEALYAEMVSIMGDPMGCVSAYVGVDVPDEYESVSDDASQ